MPLVLLATFQLMPGGEHGGEESLPAALTERGIDARWACWDDPSVDWAAADLVAVRSTWDYHRRLPQFLAWARGVEATTPLLNGADVFAWNADKAYLAELGELAEVADGEVRVPIVPTALLDETTLVTGLEEAFDRWGRVVIKPRVAASGLGLVTAERGAIHGLQGLLPAPWVIQPLVESVRTTGESSVYVFDSRAVAQVDKRVAGAEVRVHELYGGRSRAAPLDPPRARVAEAAVRLVAQRRRADLAYARVDLMQWEGSWAVSELELIEPGLYLDVLPANAGHFADVVVSRLTTTAG